jgi:hypothetical protein
MSKWITDCRGYCLQRRRIKRNHVSTYPSHFIFLIIHFIHLQHEVFCCLYYTATYIHILSGEPKITLHNLETVPWQQIKQCSVVVALTCGTSLTSIWTLRLMSCVFNGFPWSCPANARRDNNIYTSRSCKKSAATHSFTAGRVEYAPLY